ncbi:MAG: helix-turn-helix domain-containing protein [Myxococcota bacterium]
MARTEPPRSLFGQQLRTWRRQRGLSQLQLATLAETTPRHMSFIETGRSRPGRELVLRLAECMDLPVRDRNDLLTSAGLPPAFAQRDLDEQQLRPFKTAVEAILEHHHPYPGCALDGLGTVKMTNACFRALMPGAEDKSPEQSIDEFFGPGPMRTMIENWAEVAWTVADGRRHEAARANNPRLTELTDRILAHMKDVPRPRGLASDAESPVVCARFRIGDQRISTFTTVMRFQHAREITISELRVELIFPANDAGAQFFRGLVQGQAADVLG